MPSKFIAAAALLFACISVAYSANIAVGIVETTREDGYITINFKNEPEKENYYIISDNKIIGNIHSLRKIENVYGKIRYICRYSLKNENYKDILRPGLVIALPDSDKEIDKRLQKNPYIDTLEYKKEIRSVTDGREMVLVPEGKFLVGCSVCDEDEYPERTEFLGDFYIDKFEVSNDDYKRYADIKGIKYPDYWKGEVDEKGNFTSPYFSSLPVIVSYYEGEGYAKWAGKRLPTEYEWEKAARRPVDAGKYKGGGIYTWGNGFKSGISNTEDFWLSDKTGENLIKIIAEKYGQTFVKKGYLPVEIYDSKSLSYYGVANLNGNALEWTDSWYQAYPGNMKKGKKYGKQFKVIRGGAYFLPASEARITDRKIGGMPDLYRDRIAGFRCVKKPVESDKK